MRAGKFTLVPPRFISALNDKSQEIRSGRTVGHESPEFVRLRVACWGAQSHDFREDFEPKHCILCQVEVSRSDKSGVAISGLCRWTFVWETNEIGKRHLDTIYNIFASFCSSKNYLLIFILMYI